MKLIRIQLSAFYHHIRTLFVMAICLYAGKTEAIESTLNLELPVNQTLLITLLILLCLWLGYRLLASRLELLNIQAIDFHALADNAHDGIFIVQNEKLVYANQRACEILGYNNTELLKLKLIDIVHPDEAQQVLEIHQRRLRGEDVAKQYEAHFRNKQSNAVPVELTAAVTTWHGKNASLVIIRDITDRKLIQQTLLDSEKRYRSLVENSPDAILIIDAEQNSIIEANERTCELFLMDKQDLFDLKLEQLASNLRKNKKPLSHYLERALHGLPLIFEYTFTNGEDNPFTCEVRLSRMPFPKRRLIRANITDISDRKLYQTAIRKSEQRLSNFFEASFEILFFHDNGIVTDVNNQVERLFGFTRDEVIGRHVLEFVAPESLEEAKMNLSQGNDGPYELLAQDKEGKTFPVQIQAKTLELSGSTMRIVSVADISQLKETHQELDASRQELQAIIDNMLDTFYRTDVAGKITMVSPSVEKMFGYKPEEILGTTMSSYYADPYERQFFLDSLKNNNGVVEAYEAALRHKNGTILWVSTNACFIYDTDGNFAGVEGITRDITEYRNYRIALNQANEELEIKIDRRTRQLQDKIAELEKLQLALSTSENNFRILVENAVDAFLLHDMKGRIIDINQQACKSLGYSRTELLALKIEDIDVGPTPVSFEKLSSILQTQNNYHVESTHQRKDGSQFPVEVNIGLLTKGKKKLILALARDIRHRNKSGSPIKQLIETSEVD
ncbi:MAG: PAS domain S-box protein [Gammaproteobacteria bacterium]|nr:PAS domain S-box protein [Gammaproteobacteria bacterium]